MFSAGEHRPLILANRAIEKVERQLHAEEELRHAMLQEFFGRMAKGNGRAAWLRRMRTTRPSQPLQRPWVQSVDLDDVPMEA
jgi:hypothetical protein